MIYHCTDCGGDFLKPGNHECSYKLRGKDNINHPSHYTTDSIECIDALEAMLTHEEFIGYLRGACFKYQWRCRYKGKTEEDLRKNEWYLERLIKTLEKSDADTP